MRDPCRPPLRTAGEMLLGVLLVPKTFISERSRNLEALAVPLRFLDCNLHAKHKQTTSAFLAAVGVLEAELCLELRVVEWFCYQGGKLFKVLFPIFLHVV